MAESLGFTGVADEQPDFLLLRVGSGLYELKRPFRYQDPEFGTIHVPASDSPFVTDLASVPWYTQWFVPVLGSHTPAVLLHDALVGDPSAPDYRTQDGQTISPDSADRIFGDALRVQKVNPIRRLILTSAAQLDTARKGSPKRFAAWVLIVLALTISHSLDIVGATAIFPWLNTGWPFFVKWGVSSIAVSLLLAIAGMVIFPPRYAKSISAQALIVGIVFLPVLAMLPGRLLLVWLPELFARSS